MFVGATPCGSVPNPIGHAVVEEPSIVEHVHHVEYAEQSDLPERCSECSCDVENSTFAVEVFPDESVHLVEPEVPPDRKSAKHRVRIAGCIHVEQLNVVRSTRCPQRRVRLRSYLFFPLTRCLGV